MSIVKINSYINIDDITEEEALNKANILVNNYDTINDSISGENVITKLYYIVPKLGKIIVVVNEDDKDILGVQDNVLANTNISDYPLVKLPSKIIEYKELIIKLGSILTNEQILNAAQAVADNTSIDSFPYKLPIVKIINYNNTDVSQLVVPSLFGSNTFLSSDSTLINNGNASNGQDILEGNIGIDISIETKIMASDEGEYDYFGNSVAMSNDYIVVGSPYNDIRSSGDDNSGAVYIFDLDGNQLNKLTASDAQDNDFFGNSVAISDTKILVGAHNEDTNGTDAGAAYIYDLDGSNEIKITASDGTENSRFGHSVAVLDAKVVVGSIGDNTNGDYSGAAYIYG